MTKDDPKRSRGRPSTLDAEKTLRVAMQAYWTEDPSDISLNEICKRAGVSKPSLYRGFGSEDGFMRAVLDVYAAEILADAFDVLSRNASLQETLDALIQFATDDPKMETGCLFYKMRAGKHRLGPLTRERVDEIDAAAIEAYERFFHGRRDAGDWSGDLPIPVAARYLSEQIGLAFAQRAAGDDQDQIRNTLELALSVLKGR